MIKVIAEIGKNFCINEEVEPTEVLLERARALIVAAKESGADIAKFQTHFWEDEIHPEAHLLSPHFSVDRMSWVKRNTYPVEFWLEIQKYCREVGIQFLSTPMSRGAAELLDDAGGVDMWKVGSADITDFVLLDYIRDSGKPVILSTGMSTLDQVRAAYEFVKEKVEDVTILHCVSLYPCPLNKLNLATIPFLRYEFVRARIGFSDHSTGIEGALMAAYLGAEVIEKHFTFDRTAFGPDHKVSLHPDEMAELTKRIKNNDFMLTTEEAFGVKDKIIHEEEKAYHPAFRKNLFAARDIKAGEIFTADCFYAMRSEKGVAADKYVSLIGKTAVCDYKRYEAIG